MKYTLLLIIGIFTLTITTTNVYAIAIKNEGVKEKKIEPQNVDEGIASPGDTDGDDDADGDGLCDTDGCEKMETDDDESHDTEKADLKELAEQLVNKASDDASDTDTDADDIREGGYTVGAGQVTHTDDEREREKDVEKDGDNDEMEKDTCVRLSDGTVGCEVDDDTDRDTEGGDTTDTDTKEKADAKKALDAFQSARHGDDIGTSTRDVDGIDRVIDILSDTSIGKADGQWVAPEKEVKIQVRDEGEIVVKEAKETKDGEVQVRGKKKAKLFGIFDIEIEVEAELSKTGEVKYVQKPWYSFLLW